MGSVTTAELKISYWLAVEWLFAPGTIKWNWTIFVTSDAYIFKICQIGSFEILFVSKWLHYWQKASFKEAWNRYYRLFSKTHL